MYERRWGLSCRPQLAEFLRSQYDTPELIAARQWQKLQEHVGFTFAKNRFYRERLDAIGFEPGDLKDPTDFAKLPILTKEDLRVHGDAMITDGYARDQMLAVRTGGSTGVPVHLLWDHEAHRFKMAMVKRHDAWAGYQLGMKLASLWGDTEKARSPKERLFAALCERTVFLDTLLMDEAHMRDFVQTLRRYRPKILIGHAHSIFFFTEYLEANGIDDIQFEGIISTAETLAPSERARIESHFGRIVFDRYGCEEVALIASECEEHSGLHISSEGLYVEVLGASEETPGRIVLTDLSNRGMPLIRYEVGDLATLAHGTCTCGRGLPRLGRVYGRVTDVLFAPDGRKISGVSILDTFIIHVAGVRQAQIVQDRIDHITLRIVRDANYSQATLDHLNGAVANIFGVEMRHSIEYVEEIAPTARGKFQFTICNFDPDSP